MRMVDIIYKKREGYELTKDEIRYVIESYTKDLVPDYQVASLLMAIYFKDLSKNEIFYLTEAMMLSGDVIDLSAIDGIKVDKHSTGGVGDTTTLIVGPLVAACGVPVAKMSGRGLGHTGGTIDKLESIKGFKVEISNKKFIDIVNRVKLSVIGQSGDLAPADKKLYALRDVTATVDNIGLIASSIMSKKLAAGTDAILLDVKIGSGAFMKDLNHGLLLAQHMVEIGEQAKKKTVAILTDMSQPLGNAVGNSLEVKEAIQVLRNEGPADLKKLCIYLAGNMVLLANKAKSLEEALEMVRDKLESGKAFDKFKEFVMAQGGDRSVIDEPSNLPEAKYIYTVHAKAGGYVEGIKADDIGLAALILGAGRESKDAIIDLSAGLILHGRIGDKILDNEPIATLYTNDEFKLEQASSMVLDAFRFSKEKVELPKLIKAMVSSEGIKNM